jgi:4-hydroxy-3-methylbut-2-enyl diphosphate reductase
LVETAKQYSVHSYLIEDASEIQFDWLDNVTTLGLTSGASVPDFLVQEVLTSLQKKYGAISVRNVKRIDERIEFALPREISS